MSARRRRRGFTLVEMMIAIAVAAVLLTLAAPGFRDFILVQRLKGVHAQLLTDLQYARGEAASRGEAVDFRVSPLIEATGQSCYIIYTDTAARPSSACDCQRPEGSRCVGTTAREIRTVQVPASGGVRLSTPSGFHSVVAFDPLNGSILLGPSNTLRGDEYRVLTAIDATRSLQATLSKAGRVNGCVPTGSSVSGPAC